MKILLAEDDQNIATIVQLVLNHVGHHEVVLATDGEQALTLALGSSFDLLLLDGMMPKKNGVAVCSEYQSQGGKAPVIFLSAKSQQKDYDEFLAHGIGFIQKPFDANQICHQIEQIMREGMVSLQKTGNG